MNTTSLTELRRERPSVFKSASDAKEALAFVRRLAARTKAQGESTDALGGSLVPEGLASAIINLVDLNGVFRRYAQSVTMGEDSVVIARKTAGLTATFAAENASMTESSLALDGVTLVAKKLNVFVKSSTELNDDAAINLAELLAVEIARAIYLKMDDCGFNGDGTATFGGMTGLTQRLITTGFKGNVAAAGGHNTWLTLDSTDLANALNALPSYAWAGAKWFVSQAGYSTLFCRLASSLGGGFINVVNGVPQYLGLPIVLCPKLPTTASSQSGKAMLLVGDLSLAATCGMRRDISVARSWQRYLEFDQIAWRGTCRFDCVNHDPGDATNAGPVVALVGTT